MARGPSRRTTEQILDAASRLQHPNDLTAKHASDMAKARERAIQLMRDRPDLRVPPEIRVPPDLEAAFGGSFRALGLEEMLAATVQEGGPQLGECPTEPMGAPRLSVAVETHEQTFHDVDAVPRGHVRPISAGLRFQSQGHFCGAKSSSVAHCESSRTIPTQCVCRSLVKAMRRSSAERTRFGGM